MTVQSTDKTEAADEIQYLLDSRAGTASATTQKVLTDDSTGQSVEVGDPADLALTADEQAKFLSDADASLTAILAARLPAAPVADSGTDADVSTGADAVPSQS
jgi:hypothetical protein